MITLWLVACARQPSGPSSRHPRLVIAHTNDQHARFRPEPADFLDGHPEVGGARALSGNFEALRATWGESLIVLDAGDLVSGGPLDEYVVRGAEGGAMLDWLAAADYDLWTVGNHEFDRGLANSAALVAASTIPVLSANLTTPEGEPAFPGLAASAVLEAGPITVGVIGATTDRLGNLVRADLGAMRVGDPVEAVRLEAERLRPQVDVLVALTHLGVESEIELAKAVPLLDIVVGGHSHTRMEAARRVGETWVVQAGSYQQGLGVAIIDPEDTTGFSWEMRTPTEATVPAPPSAAVEVFASEWEARVAADWGMIVGRSGVALDRVGDGESPLGRWVCAALRRGTGADLAVINGGGLRADLPIGDLSREDVYRILPFGNEVVVVEVTGAEVSNLAIRNATARLHPEESYPFQQDGLSYGFRSRLGSADLVSLVVNGARLDPGRTYRVATTDFVLGQWKRIFGVEANVPVPTGRSELDVVLADLKRGDVLAAPPDPGTFLP